MRREVSDSMWPHLSNLTSAFDVLFLAWTLPHESFHMNFAWVLLSWSTLLVATSNAIHAFIIETPSRWNIGRNTTLSWQTTAESPAEFMVILFNPALLSAPCQLVQRVSSSLGYCNFILPDLVPGDGYYLGFVNPTNPWQIYATSGTFGLVYDPANDPQSVPVSGGGPVPSGVGPAPIYITIYSTVTAPPSTVVVTHTITSSIPGSASTTYSSSHKSYDLHKWTWSLLFILLLWTQHQL